MDLSVKQAGHKHWFRVNNHVHEPMTIARLALIGAFIALIGSIQLRAKTCSMAAASPLMPHSLRFALILLGELLTRCGIKRRPCQSPLR